MDEFACEYLKLGIARFRYFTFRRSWKRKNQYSVQYIREVAAAGYSPVSKGFGRRDCRHKDRDQ